MLGIILFFVKRYCLECGLKNHLNHDHHNNILLQRLVIILYSHDVCMMKFPIAKVTLSIFNLVCCNKTMYGTNYKYIQKGKIKKCYCAFFKAFLTGLMNF